MEHPYVAETLYDAEDGADLGPATPEQAAASREAAQVDGGSGIILIDRDGDVVAPGGEGQPWVRGPVRRAYTA